MLPSCRTETLDPLNNNFLFSTYFPGPWGGGHGNPLQYSCLENPMDRGAWQAMFHGVAKNQTGLKQLNTSSPGKPPFYFLFI